MAFSFTVSDPLFSTSRVAILMPTRELAIQCHAVAIKLASHIPYLVHTISIQP
jgi:superfamily II DNA/RNA helicase